MWHGITSAASTTRCCGPLAAIRARASLSRGSASVDELCVQSEQPGPGSHELVNGQVRVRDKAFRPQDDATVKLEVQEPDGTKLDLSAESR